MSNFLIELSAVHLALMLGYWIFLRKERQYATMRFYLIGAVVLSLIIPILKLPRLWRAEEPIDVVPSGVIAAHPIVTSPVDPMSFWTYDLLVWASIIVSVFLLLKFFNSVRRLMVLRRKSRYAKSNGIYIHSVRNMKGSFSFFNWIFIGEEIDKGTPAYEVMLAHEQAHTTLGHTYDIIFLELFRVCFWWLPTTWLLNKEIKKIHEYQADAYVLKAYSVDEYSSILISATLKLNGLSLVSSFHDGLILKRLTAMKQQTKNVSSWKLGALAALCASLFIGFACTEEQKNGTTDGQSKEEIFTIVEKTPEFKGGVDAFYNYMRKEIRYPKDARQKGLEGRVDVQFVIGKDGSLTDIQVVNGIGESCDIEAARVLKNAPSFTPGMQNGKPVRVRMAVPILFKLDKSDATNPKGIVVIEKLQPINAKFTVSANYNNGEWSGSVSDEEGEGLPGVNIIVEGTTTGTVSNLDGTFALKADKSKDLVLSFVGYDGVKLAGNK